MRFISIISASRRPKSKVRTIRLWTGLSWILLIIFIFTSLGVFKASGMWADYYYYKSVFYVEKKSNERIKRDIISLQKTTDEIRQRMADWFAFEDKTRLIFGIKPVAQEERELGTGGTSSFFEESGWTDNKNFIGLNQLGRDINLLRRQSEYETYQFESVKDFISKQYHYWDHYPTIWPTQGRITSTFGYRVHPVVGYTCMHEGMDIAAPRGEVVLASANGIVHYTGYSGKYGNLLILHHGTYQTVYGHLSQILVRESQMVQRGDLIGYVGQTGMATGPHLHYEVRSNNQRSLNPMQFILGEFIVVD